MLEKERVAHCTYCTHALQWEPLKVPVKNNVTTLISGFNVFPSGCYCGPFKVEELDEKQQKLLNRNTRVWFR